MNYSSEDEDQEESEDVCIPVTIYNGTRDSARSQYAAVPSRSPSTESSHTRVQVEVHSFADEGSNIIEVTTDEEISEKMKNSGSNNQVPTACSWPSISGCISVKTPSIGSTQTSSSEYCGDYFSSTCDSGYSEPDICITGSESDNFNFKIIGKSFSIEIKCIEEVNFDVSPSTKSDKETQTEPFPTFNNSNETGLAQLNLKIDKITETSIEELSECSDLSKEGNCSESYLNIAQLLEQSSSFGPSRPKSVIKPNIHTHNVSKKYLERLQIQKFNPLPTVITDKGK